MSNLIGAKTRNIQSESCTSPQATILIFGEDTKASGVISEGDSISSLSVHNVASVKTSTSKTSDGKKIRNIEMLDKDGFLMFRTTVFLTA